MFYELMARRSDVNVNTQNCYDNGTGNCDVDWLGVLFRVSVFIVVVIIAIIAWKYYKRWLDKD